MPYTTKLLITATDFGKYAVIRPDGHRYKPRGQARASSYSWETARGLSIMLNVQLGHPQPGEYTDVP